MTGEVDAHARRASGDRNGNNQRFFFDPVLNEPDLAWNVHAFEDRFERINERPSGKLRQVGGQVQGGHDPGASAVRSEFRGPGVHEKEDADRKNEDEWADEQPEIKVQVSSQPIKSPFHLAGILSRQQEMSTAFRAGLVTKAPKVILFRRCLSRLDTLSM